MTCRMSRTGSFMAEGNFESWFDESKSLGAHGSHRSQIADHRVSRASSVGKRPSSGEKHELDMRKVPGIFPESLQCKVLRWEVI